MKPDVQRTEEPAQDPERFEGDARTTRRSSPFGYSSRREDTVGDVCDCGSQRHVSQAPVNTRAYWSNSDDPPVALRPEQHSGVVTTGRRVRSSIWRCRRAGARPRPRSWSGEPETSRTLTPLLKDAVSRADGFAELYRAATVTELVTEIMYQRRVACAVLTMSGVLTLFLATIGVYSVVCTPSPSAAARLR